MDDRDQNSKYFHAVIVQRRRCFITTKMLLQDGTTLDTPELIHEEAVRYFENFLSQDDHLELPSLTNLI